MGAQVLFFIAFLVGTSGSSIGDAATEELARERAGNIDLSTLEGSDMEVFVRKGWHSVIRAIVARSHQGTEQEMQRTATQVRQAVQAEKNRLDDLIRALDRNYGKAVDVNPAMQWAQNSTHVFIAVKFAQRWNAPGALEVENETFSVIDCCVSFTAFGEHSMIRRKYMVNLEFFRGLNPSGSSWVKMAAGRISMTLQKAAAAHWPRLVKVAASAPHNLGIWRDMRDRWTADLEKLPKLEDDDAKKKKAKVEKPKTSRKSKRRSDDDDDDDAVDKEVDALSDCDKSTYAGTSVAELCADAWSGVVENPSVKGRRWIVEFYTSDGTGKLAAMRDLMPIWKRLADVFPSLVVGGRVGSVDCGREKDLCKKMSVDQLPHIRRFPGVSVIGDIWSGELDASIDDFAAFGGGGRSEL